MSTINSYLIQDLMRARTIHNLVATLLTQRTFIYFVEYHIETPRPDLNLKKKKNLE